MGWLSYKPFHAFLEHFISTKEQCFASYKVVYAAWHQGLFSSRAATEEQLRRERNHYHDLLHAGVEAKFLPMSQSQGEKGTDVADDMDGMDDMEGGWNGREGRSGRGEGVGTKGRLRTWWNGKCAGQSVGEIVQLISRC